MAAPRDPRNLIMNNEARIGEIRCVFLIRNRDI